MAFKIRTGNFLEQEAEIMVIPTSRNSATPVGAISERVYKAAGYSKMYDARESFGELSPGDIVVTSGFALNVRNIIFACVPKWQWRFDYSKEHSQRVLRMCIIHALQWAEQNEVKSISFPLMGTWFPRDVAEMTASAAIRTHIRTEASFIDVYLILPPSEEPIYEDMTESESPVSENYIDCYAEYDIRFEENFRNSGMSKDAFCQKYVRDILTYRITNAEQLAKTIDYDKGDLSNFRNGKLKKPAKHRVIAMAIYMGLSDEERYNFIRSVGHNKYPEDERDRIVEKLMRSGYRDFESINNELCRINPDFDLKAKTKKGKKKDKSKEKE